MHFFPGLISSGEFISSLGSVLFLSSFQWASFFTRPLSKNFLQYFRSPPVLLLSSQTPGAGEVGVYFLVWVFWGGLSSVKIEAFLFCRTFWSFPQSVWAKSSKQLLAPYSSLSALYAAHAKVSLSIFFPPLWKENLQKGCLSLCLLSGCLKHSFVWSIQVVLSEMCLLFHLLSGKAGLSPEALH